VGIPESVPNAIFTPASESAHAVTQPVIHPHLHEVGMMRRKFADIGAGFLWSLRAVAVVRGICFPGIFEEPVARGIETRTAQGSGALSVSYFVNLIFVLSEGCNCRHTVRKIFVELLENVFLRGSRST
jgi:hypothetical protein